MIQRIQTLFLLGVIICMTLVLVFPIWEKTNPDTGVKYTFDAIYWHEYQQNDSNPNLWELKATNQMFYLVGLSAVVCLIALYSIFQFKRRTVQIKLGALNAFLMMAYIATATYFIYQGENKMDLDARGIFKPGYFLPIGAMIFNSMSNRFIKKDEDLVRSIDRIR
ncbi:MAG: DUF4293 domain-containing protein [Cyclobacteriaceae bacterium]|nr:DUF4293 domain-containing protein [Cyclobacteriaceae bacterium]MCK5278884.1 DUF4293 domain-containing protein [Cyclobacteriaceae bacterium]MCK5470972.1 DUF4293 domain-containing protein [Cyclobacteriaceae bacterium]